MQDPSDPTTAILAHINAARAQLDAAQAILTGGAPPRPAAGAGAIADDADLDSQWGNPTVRKDPPRWAGQSYAGATYADCPPDYLTTLAGFLDWQAGKCEEKNEMTTSGKPRAPYLRKDAARARGWAARNAAKPGARPAARKAESMNEPDEEIPF